jgi:hypothetical protein
MQSLLFPHHHHSCHHSTNKHQKQKKMLRRCAPSRDAAVYPTYDDLQRFLSSIALYCNDAELAASALHAASGLSSRWQEKGIERFPADVANVAMILDAFITMTSRAGGGSNTNSNDQNNRNCSNTTSNSSRPLPANVVYEVHSFMGLLNMAQKNDAAAKVSFMKALWITAAMSATTSSKPEQDNNNNNKGYELALTLHRLGKIHARTTTSCSNSSGSNYNEAKNLLTKALEQYEKNAQLHLGVGGGSSSSSSSKADHHFLVLDVKNELEQLHRRRKKREANEMASSMRSRAFQSLPFILEEKTSSSSSSQVGAAERLRRYSSTT